MYCIMRTEKRKRTDLSGIQRENDRTATEYNNKIEPGMDILNVSLVQSDNWMQDIQQEIDRADEQQAENSRLRAVESQIQDDITKQQRIARQLAEMNQRARREFAQTKRQTEQVKNFLTIAEQRQLDELYKGGELER